VEVKDIKTFIWSARQVCDKMPGKVHFLIMGPCGEESVYVDQCMSLRTLLNLDGVMDFTGNVDLREYLGKLIWWLLRV